MTQNRHDEAMDKPLTMQDAALRLNAAVGRIGADLLRSLRLPGVDAWAMARKVDEFRVKCRCLDIDPEPPLARARERYEQSAIAARLGPQQATSFEQCIEDEWHRLLRDHR